MWQKEKAGSAATENRPPESHVCILALIALRKRERKERAGRARSLRLLLVC